jgi:signal transduction histidine kinase
MRRSPLTHLRTRLLLLIGLVVIPILGLTLRTNLELRRVASARAREDALRLVRITAVDQRDMIKDTGQLLFALAQLPEVHSADPILCSTFLVRLLGQYPQYALLGVVEPDGNLVCSAPPARSPVNLADHVVFQQAMDKSDLAIGGYQVDRVTGKATLDLGRPILDDAGQVQALILASLDLTWLNELATAVELPEGSTLTMFDRNGTVLVRYPDSASWVGRAVPEAPIVGTILAQQGEGTVESRGIDGISRLFAYLPLYGAPAGQSVYISIGIPTSVAFRETDQLLIRNLIGLGAATVLALAVAWFGGDLLVVRRLNRLVGAARRLGGGDLNVRTGLPYNDGELGQLAYAFDEMAESLERSTRDRDRAREALQAAYRTLEQQVAQRTRELSALYEVTAVASASLDLDTVLQSSLEHLLAVVNGEIGAFHLLDEQKEVLYLAARYGDAPDLSIVDDPMPLCDGLTGLVVERDAPLVLPDVADGPRPLVALPLAGSHAYVGVPMHAKGRVLGVLSVIGHAGRDFGQQDVSLLASIADQVGVAVENARLYQQAEQLAVVSERQRLARELHDSVTQALYSLVLLSEAGRRLASTQGSSQLEEVTTRLGEIGQQALKEMRLLVYELRSLTLQERGLVRALEQRLDAVEKRAGIRASLSAEGALELPAPVEEALYRIVQEALNNALKHASATAVSVRVAATDGRVEIEVADDGKGFDPDAVRDRGGMGLANMQERIAELGGQLAIRSTPGKGTTVEVTLDVPGSVRQVAGREPSKAGEKVS